VGVLAAAPGTAAPLRPLLRALADAPDPDDGPGSLAPLEEVARTLRLVDLAEGPDGEEALAEAPDPAVAAVRSATLPAEARAALRALAPLEVGRDVGDGLEGAVALLVEDPAWGGSREALEMRACRLAAQAEVRGRPWLARALLARVTGSRDRVGVALFVETQLRHDAAVAAWKRGETAEVARALLAPLLRTPLEHVGPVLRREAAALDAALAHAQERPAPPPTAAAWEAAGLEERLAALDAALLAGRALDEPFPPDAHGHPPPTLGDRLDAIGWDAVPMLIARVDHPGLLRREGRGPGGRAQVGDAAWEALGLWGVGWASDRAGRRETAEAWWERWREQGPVRCVQSRIETVRALEGINEPIPAATLATWFRRALRALPGAACHLVRVARTSGGPEGAIPWLEAAAYEGDPQLLPELEAAAASDHPGLSLAGAIGLERCGDEEARARAAWIARQLLAAGGSAAPRAIALLWEHDRAAWPPLLLDATATAGARSDDGPGLVRLLLEESAELGSVRRDARLGLARLAALRFGAWADGVDRGVGLSEELPAALRSLADALKLPPAPPTLGPALLADELGPLLLLHEPHTWRDEPERRHHAALTALLLGPAALERLAGAGLDPRGAILEALTDERPERVRRLRAGLGRRAAEVEAWLRTWLAGADEPLRSRALARLAAPNPRALLVGAVTVEGGLGEPLVARARRLERREASSAALAALVRGWADDAAGPPALRLRLVRSDWRAATLELAPVAGGGPAHLTAEVRRRGPPFVHHLAGPRDPGLADLVDDALRQLEVGRGLGEVWIVATR